VTLSNGSGSLATTTLSAATHSIKAVYGGDTVTNGSSSPILTQAVKNATTLSLTSSENPGHRNDSVVFTAKVSPKAATGAVQFFDGTTLLGTANLVSGVGSLQIRLSAGTHPIHAVYGGDAATKTYGGNPVEYNVGYRSMIIGRRNIH
jgi:hypothetical protein